MRAVGSLVRLTYDAPSTLVAEGDVIRTRTGRAYRVWRARRQTRGKWTGRWHLQAVVLDPAEVTEEDTVHELVWYAR